MTGWCEFGARDLIPSEGRWAERDPLGLAAGVADLYRFNFNDPEEALDSSGCEASKLSKPSDPNALTAAQLRGVILPALAGHIDESTPFGEIRFSAYFEAASIRMHLATKYSRQRKGEPRFDSPIRATKPNGKFKVLPDASCTVVRMRGGMSPSFYRDSEFMDAKFMDKNNKTGRSNVALPSYDYEAVGYADVLSRSPAAKAGVRPLMVYITTADTTIGQDTVDEFTRNNVAVVQQYVARDPSTGKLYLTSPIFLNPSLQQGVNIVTPKVQFTPNWDLFNPKVNR